MAANKIRQSNDRGIYSPKLDWKEGAVPYSIEFGDIYYSTFDAIGERQHVFLSGINAPACWAEKSHYVIAETGFGTGLNFLLTWARWKQTSRPGARLFYVAVEGAPLALPDLEKAHAQHSELAQLSAELRRAFPVLHPGYHQIELDGGLVSLLLLFGPAQEMLDGLSLVADAWYLDGFAPSRNPAMWSPEVFAAIAERSKKGTRIATYTTARTVRDGLQAVGFNCTKVAGFAGKRSSLSGAKEEDGVASRRAPWYRRSEPLKPGSKIAVIGAGISGACIGSALKSAGADVTIIDRHNGPAGDASGNPAGLMQPRPGGGNPAYERLQTSAYFDAVRTYDALSIEHDIWVGNRGVLSFGRDEAFLARHIKWLSAGGLPEDHAKAVESNETNDIAGVNIDCPGAWFPKAGTLNPGIICRALIGQIPALYGVQVSKIKRNGPRWALLNENGKTIMEADGVVLANGFAAVALCPDSEVPLYAKRGQLSYMQATVQSKKLKVGLSYGGYATPLVNLDEGTGHILGATYQQWPDFQSNAWQNIEQKDHAENLAYIGARLPLLEAALSGPIVGGRANLRTTTTDHLPVVGPAFNANSYRHDYKEIRHGKRPENFPDADYTPGVFMLTALGSRGFALAPLLAKMLCAEMMGTPSPVDAPVQNLVHPARFLVRQLKRG